MIGYVTLGSNDIPRAAGFYDALLGLIDAKRLMDFGSFIAWGTAMGQPMLAVTKPYTGGAATIGNGVMVALQVSSKEQVNALHAKALELGGANEGAAGPRGDGFYAGYFRDLDGNKLNVFCLG